MAEVTRVTRIDEVVRICPAAREVLARHGMACSECIASSSETIEDGALMHDIDVERLLSELNAVCRNE